MLIYRHFIPGSFIVYLLVNCPITMENHHFMAGKSHYEWPFSIANSVSLPEGNLANNSRVLSPLEPFKIPHHCSSSSLYHC